MTEAPTSGDFSAWDREPETAFPGVAHWLQEALGDARLDRKGMQSTIHLCSLADCSGVCCSDGAYLEADEPTVLERLVHDRGGELEALGADLSEPAIVHGERRGRDRPSSKTATRLVCDNAGRTHTACVFWLTDGRCSLQVLGAESGKHPWHFKPAACWLHPLDLTSEGVGMRVGLFRGVPPPEGSPPSIGSAPCSQRAVDGPRAIDALRRELAFLAGITGWRPAVEEGDLGA